MDTEDERKLVDMKELRTLYLAAVRSTLSSTFVKVIATMTMTTIASVPVFLQYCYYHTVASAHSRKNTACASKVIT